MKLSKYNNFFLWTATAAFTLGCLNGESFAQGNNKQKANPTTTLTSNDSKTPNRPNQETSPGPPASQPITQGTPPALQQQVIGAQPQVALAPFDAKILFKTAPATVDGKLTSVKFGDFKFEIILPPGWSDRATVESQRRALDALNSDGNDSSPTFVFSKAKSGLIYGTLQIVPTGKVFPSSAFRLSAEVIPPEWKISKDSVVSGEEILRRNLPISLSYSNIRGTGNGLIFDPLEQLTTHATWLVLPAVYKNEKGYHSVNVGLYSRAIDADSSETISILAAILDSIKLESGELITIDEYKLITSTGTTPGKGPIAASGSSPKPETEKPRYKFFQSANGEIRRCDENTGDCSVVGPVPNSDTNGQKASQGGVAVREK
jgi:hypothetical protein